MSGDKLREVEKAARELIRQSDLKVRFAGYRRVTISEWVRDRLKSAAQSTGQGEGS